MFDGRHYRGVIVKIGWCAERGYAAKVLYKDGYAEWVQVTKFEESHRKEDEIKRRVQSNLKWMGKRFYGVQFSKQYMGKDYVGVVNAVRWIRGQGYVVNVLYSDGYTEILQLKELEKVLKQGRFGAVRTFGSTASGPLRPKVEHCVSFHVTVGENGEAV